jgi:DNA-nicking Smr family endonuclease
VKPPRPRSLADLAALRDALAEQARAAAKRTAHERAEAERREHERTLFARSVGAVAPLPSAHARRGGADAPRPAALPRQRRLDEQAVLRESLSDEIDVETLLDTDESLSYRRHDIGPDVVRRLRRGEWAIQAEVDLHGLRRDEARERLAAFLREAAQRGLRCVRVVHGKGHGSPGRAPVLKLKVRGWLVQTAAVLAFVQARAADGGHGALVVLLRPGAA